MGLSFQEQLTIEAEGGAAGLRGLTREDCPYPREAREWDHWVYGCETARGEQQIIERGTLEWYNEEGGYLYTSSVIEDYRNGIWRPRFARVPI